MASLERAGLALFMAHGVEGVTVDSLVREAAMAKGNFYRYFEDIEALLRHLLAPAAAAVRAAFEACETTIRGARHRKELVDAYEALAAALAIAVLSSPDVVRLYLQESRGAAIGVRRPIAALAAEIRERSLRLTEAAHAHGLLRKIPAVVSAHAVVGAVEELVFIGLSGSVTLEPTSVAADLVDLVLNGLRA